MTEVDDGDRSPPAAYRTAYAEYRKLLDADLKQWQALRDQDLTALNAALKAAGHTELKAVTP